MNAFSPRLPEFELKTNDNTNLQRLIDFYLPDIITPKRSVSSVFNALTAVYDVEPVADPEDDKDLFHVYWSSLEKRHGPEICSYWKIVRNEKSRLLYLKDAYSDACNYREKSYIWFTYDSRYQRWVSMNEELDAFLNYKQGTDADSEKGIANAALYCYNWNLYKAADELEAFLYYFQNCSQILCISKEGTSFSLNPEQCRFVGEPLTEMISQSRHGSNRRTIMKFPVEPFEHMMVLPGDDGKLYWLKSYRDCIQIGDYVRYFQSNNPEIDDYKKQLFCIQDIVKNTAP